jgi:RHS repeat-associated protein
VHGYSNDAESRIVKVDNGSTATYSYDAANRRVKRVQGPYTTYYVWEGSKVIVEYSNAPAGAGGARFYHPDRLSKRIITDGSGAVKGEMDNLPFGENGGGVGESEKHRFTSYERDAETGSDYAVNRQYSQSTARFTRPDPLTASADPRSLNRYSYAGNDAVNWADPLGLDPTACFMLDGVPSCGISGFRYGGGGVYGGFHGDLGLLISRVYGWVDGDFVYLGRIVSFLDDGFSFRRPGGKDGSVKRVGAQMSPDQCLRDCYTKALDVYNAVGNTSEQQVVDVIESASPLSLQSLAGGVDEAVKVLKGAPAFVTRNGLQGPVVRGSAGSALKSGAGKAMGGVAGKAFLGAALGGLLTQILDPFIGREKFLRDAVDECNSGCSGATKNIQSQVFGTVGKLRDFLRRR